MRCCFVAGLVLIPLNDLPLDMPPIGEAGLEASLPPLLLCAALALVRGGRWGSPSAATRVLMACGLAVIVWAGIGFVVSSPAIVGSAFKGRSGVDKFAAQFAMLVAQALAAFGVYRCLRSYGDAADAFRVATRGILAGLALSLGVAGLEALAADPSHPLNRAFELVNPHIHSRRAAGPGLYHVYSGRVRSLSGEASWFGNYLGFAAPWAFCLAGSWTPALRIGVLAAVALTLSRTAYAITALQVSVIALSGWRGSRGMITVSAMGVVAILTISWIQPESQAALKRYGSVTTSYGLTANLSNETRYGCQLAAVSMAFSHPVFGVGLGQYGFHVSRHLPAFIQDNPEVETYRDPAPGTTWPPAHGLHARVLGELGIPGLVALLAVVFGSGVTLVALSRHGGDARLIDAARCLAVSWLGWFMAGFCVDTFRCATLPVLLGLTWFVVDSLAECMPRPVPPPR
jgi:hypothetical protein